MGDIGWPGAIQTIERDSIVPIYQQIYEELREAILTGTLPEATRLPPERALAPGQRWRRPSSLLSTPAFEWTSYGENCTRRWRRSPGRRRNADMPVRRSTEQIARHRMPMDDWRTRLRHGTNHPAPGRL